MFSVVKGRELTRSKRRKAAARPDDRPLLKVAPDEASSSSLASSSLASWAPWFALLAAARPVSAEDLWWHAARGREVLTSMTVSPARRLLLDQTTNETDWLGGVPLYLLFEAAGFVGVFAGKLLLAAALLGLLLKLTPRRTCLLVLLPAAALTVASPALLPGGRGIGLLCLAGLLAWRETTWKRRWQRSLVLAGLTCLWANGGPLFILAPVVVLLSFDDRSEIGIRELAITLLAGSITPRGFSGWGDSLRLAAPWLFEQSATLNDTSFAPLEISEPLSWLFAGFSAIGLLLLFGASRQRPGALAWMTATAAGLANAWLAPLAAIWLCGEALAAMPSKANVEPSDEPSEETRRETGAERGARGRVSAIVDWGVGGLAAVLLLAGGLGAIGSPHGWGMGVAAELEPRLLEQSIADSPRGAAWTWDAAATGAAAWCGLKPLDSPDRALVAGRLRGLRLAVDDLRYERRNRYLRSDGTWGGWWLWTRRAEQPLLWIVVSSRDVASLRALESTGFRPTSIDSPIIAHASSYEPQMAPAIVRLLPIRNAVAHEDWTYTPPYHGGLFYDLPHFMRWDAEQRLRQGRVFWGMKLPTAALRAITTAEVRFQPLRRDCYLDLASREKRVLGKPAIWTEAVLNMLTHGQPSLDPEDATTQAIRDAARVYIADGPKAALPLLMSATKPADRYAAAQLQLELGGAVAARDTLRTLVEAAPDDPHAVRARDALRLLP